MEIITNKTIISYLLGRFTAEEEDEFLAQCFSSDENAERFESVRDDLIEKYLRGDLSKEDKNGFENHFLTDPQNRRLLDFSKNLRGILEENERLAAAVTNNEKKSFSLGISLVTVTAFGVLLVSALLIWQIISRNTKPEIAEVEPTPLPTAVPQNSPPVPASPSVTPTPSINSTPSTSPAETPKIITSPAPTPKAQPETTVMAFFLPLIGKGDEQAGILKIGGKIKQVQLQTARPFKEFSAYRIQIQNNGEVTWQGKIEKFQTKSEGRIVISVPVENLKTGRNRFIIAGIGEDGTSEELKGTERFFEVEKEK